MQTNRTVQLASLQYLRGGAAMLVVLYHALIQCNHVFLTPGEALPIIGRSGVDIFFVLSGFVMWVSTAGRIMTPGSFFKRRLVRIAPLYWAATLAAAGVALVKPQLLRSTLLEPAHLFASLFFIPWLNPAAVPSGNTERIVPLIVPGWTLNFEMLFYALFAIALVLAPRYRLMTITTLVIVTFLVAGALAPFGDIPDFYSSSIIFEFFFGVLIATIRSGIPRHRRSFFVCHLALAFLALLVCDMNAGPTPRVVVLGLPAAVIVFCASQMERERPVGDNWLLKLAGDASYSIYLTHIFVMAGLRVALLNWGVTHLPPIGIAAFLAAALALSAAIGALVYQWFELPVMRLVRRALR
ncbi:MAG: hypothetical protein RL367_453 [Pseudomonadota bacterium]|jgi:exopolysaccharide production protein ExoZ